MKEDTNKKKKIIICVIAVILVAVALIVFLYFRSQIRATTMRILRLEGEVTLTDNGKDKTVRENLRLNSGNALSTAIESLVSIGLDDTKIVTLDEMSRAEFNQSGRMLDLKLTDGSLFFEVQKPLEDDETMDIRTSTMVVGIRGTSGWVSVEGDHESLIVTDGHVHVTGVNPVTGEKKEIEVYAGQRVKTYLYNDRDVDSIMFYVEDVTERDLPEFLLDRLRENPELLEKVCKETGWDKPWILGITTPTPTPKPTASPADEKSPDTGLEDDALIDDTAEEESEETEKSGPLTKEQLAWAHSHIAVTDPNTGIFALKDMTLFDPAFYAATNPDVVARYGTDPDALLYHYLTRGKREGRPPIAPPTPTPTITPTWGIVKSSESKSEEDDGYSVQGSNTNVGPGYIAGNGQVSMNDGSTATYNNGTLTITGGSTADPTKVTLRKELYDTSTTPQTSITVVPSMVNLDQSAAGVQSIEFPHAAGWTPALANDMLSLMDRTMTSVGNTQLNEIKGDYTTINRNGSNVSATVSNSSPYIYAGEEVRDILDNMSQTPAPQQSFTVDSVTFDGQTVSRNNAGQTQMTYGTDTYTNITATPDPTTQNLWAIKGNDNNSQNVTIGYLHGDGTFTNTP